MLEDTRNRLYRDISFRVGVSYLALDEMSDDDTSSALSFTTSDVIDERVTGYIFGKMSEKDTGFPTLVVISPTDDGWRLRSTNRGYNHDYICYEEFSEVMEWIDVDMYRPFVAMNRGEAMELLVHTDPIEHRTGFLYPGDVRAGSREEANLVLSHLESGRY